MGGEVDGNRGHKTSGPISGVSVGLLFQWINAGRREGEAVEDALLRELLEFALDETCRI